MKSTKMALVAINADQNVCWS